MQYYYLIFRFIMNNDIQSVKIIEQEISKCDLYPYLSVNFPIKIINEADIINGIEYN